MVSFTVYSFVFSTLMTTTLQFGAFPGNTADLERMKKLAEIRMKIRSKIGLIDRPFVSKPARNRFTKTLLKNTISIVNKPRGEYYAEIQKVIRHSQIPGIYHYVNLKFVSCAAKIKIYTLLLL